MAIPFYGLKFRHTPCSQQGFPLAERIRSGVHQEAAMFACIHTWPWVTPGGVGLHPNAFPPSASGGRAGRREQSAKAKHPISAFLLLLMCYVFVRYISCLQTRLNWIFFLKAMFRRQASLYWSFRQNLPRFSFLKTCPNHSEKKLFVDWLPSSSFVKL